MTIYLANAFSLSMLSGESNIYLKADKLSEDAVRRYLSDRQFVSAVGHEATAQVISQRLGLPVATNRVAITLKPGDYLFVFQLKARLPEGKVLSAEEVKSLPAEWWLVQVVREEEAIKRARWLKEDEEYQEWKARFEKA